jgi:hypothetical protein
MLNHQMIIALELARERVAEADRYRLAALAQSGEARVSRTRRAVAKLAIAIARVADRSVLDGRLQVS